MLFYQTLIQESGVLQNANSIRYVWYNVYLSEMKLIQEFKKKELSKCGMWPPEVGEIIVVGKQSDSGWTLVEVVGVYGHQVDIVKGIPLMKSEVKNQQLMDTR